MNPSVFRDVTDDFSPSDIRANKLMGILAYLSWLALIPLLCARSSPYARFHARQGLTLAIFEAASALILGFLGKLLLVGWIFRLLGWLISVACTALSILGIIHVLKGKAKVFPIIGDIQIIK